MKKKRPPQPRRVVAVGEPGGAYLSYRPVVEQSNLAVLRHGHVRLPLPLEYRGGRGRQIATPKHKRQSISSESQNATPPPPPRGARAADGGAQADSAKQQSGGSKPSRAGSVQQRMQSPLGSGMIVEPVPVMEVLSPG